MAEIFRPAYHVDPATGKRVNVVDSLLHPLHPENKAAELERRGIRIDAGVVDASDVHAKPPLALPVFERRRCCSWLKVPRSLSVRHFR